LKVSNCIQEDLVSLKVTMPWKNSKKIGLDLHAEFSHELNKTFNYLAEKILKLEKNVDYKIKKKAKEIINNSSSEYKGLPNYMKIGKFVNSYLKFNMSYAGKDLSPLEIFEKRTGVCHHFTILFNAMLNAIGIRTIYLNGFVLDGNNLPGKHGNRIKKESMGAHA